MTTVFDPWNCFKTKNLSLINVSLTLLVVSSVTYFIYNVEPALLQHNMYSVTENPTERQPITNLTVSTHPNVTLGHIISSSENQILKANVTVDRDFFKYLAANLNNTSYPGVENYTKYAVARLGLSPLLDVEPLVPKFGPVINDVLSFQYPISIPPCLNNVTANRSIAIVVNSATGNFDRRKIIRQTWKNRLNILNERMAVAGFGFVLGLTEDKETQKKIEQEAETYGDIIQIGVADFYRNLSLKVAGLFNWLYRHCATVDFVFKVDDDVYVNMHNIALFFQSYNLSNPLIMFGKAAGNLFPARGGKWEMTFDEWPWNDFPPYFLGPTVMFPSSVIRPLLAAFQTTPMLHIDDLYYTGVCREKAGVKLSSSFNSTSIFVIGLPELPLPCDLRRFMSWLTVSQIHMNNSQIASDNFYRNVTQCVISNSNGINTTVDYSEPVQFYFT